MHKSQITFQLYVQDCTRTEFEQGGVLDDLTKVLAARILYAELSHHVGQEAEQAPGTPRNATNPKSVLTDAGKLAIWTCKRFRV